MGAVENVREFSDFVKKFNDTELNRRILKLEEEVIDLSRDKRRAEERVEVLERTLRLKKDLKFKEPFYWLEGDVTPYCPACWEGKDQAVHVVFTFEQEKATRWDCPSCNHTYMVKKNRAYEPPPRFERNSGGGPDGWLR